MIESRQMEAQKVSPVLNRFSIVTALLALLLTILYFLPVDSGRLPITIGNTTFTLSVIQLIPFFIGGTGFIGAFWILSAHPAVDGEGPAFRQVLPNIILPTITILVFAQILLQTNKGLTWWAVLVAGLLAFMAVFYSEYQVLKPEIGANTIFTILLIALAHGLFMAFAIALRASVGRIFFIIPAVLIASAFVAYRTLFLRSEGHLQNSWVILVMAIVLQFCIALFYLFITPNQFGLILTGILFVSNALTVRIGQGNRQYLYIEPLVLAIFMIVLMLLTKWV